MITLQTDTFKTYLNYSVCLINIFILETYKMPKIIIFADIAISRGRITIWDRLFVANKTWTEYNWGIMF